MKITGVTIEQGPADWQIIQRDTNSLGRLTLSGSFLCDETKDKFWIQARLVSERTGEPVTTLLDWQNADFDYDRKTFSLTLKDIPAGGLYRVETRIKRPFAGDKRALRGDYIHHLGVGDIYVITGQSNASGTGKGLADDGPELGVSLFGNDEKWKLAIHPLEDATHTLHPITVTTIFHGASPWLAFAKKIWHETGIPVGLIPTALGGSPISLWIKDSGKSGALFENMMDMIQKAGGRVAGVLWHQGETDAWGGEEPLNRYEERFEKMVAMMRRELNDPLLPIFTGQLNSFIGDQADDACARNWTRMREIQRQISHKLKNVYMAVTIDCLLSDEVHNSAAGCVLAGERYAALALKYHYHKSVLAECPEPTSVCFENADRTQIKICFENLAGDWTPNKVEKSLRVEDEEGVISIIGVELCPNGDIRIKLARPAKKSPILHALYGIRPEITLRDDSCRPVTPFSVSISE
jgi:hypothetical protein